MRKICISSDLKSCSDKCEIWETCPSGKTGVQIGFNFDTWNIQDRARRGVCLECGGDLCEHRLTYKDNARRF